LAESRLVSTGITVSTGMERLSGTCPTSTFEKKNKKQ